jgi:hypothetical protein
VGDRITYVGLDVQKDGIVVALAEDGLRGEVRDHGRIPNTPAALQRLVASSARREWSCGSVKRQDRAVTASNASCRQVGTTALSWHRLRSRNGRATGSKTDRRDAFSLAKLHRGPN